MSEQTSVVTWLTENCEIAALLRSYDWSATELGPIDSWPPSVKFSVEMLLQLPLPGLLMWGDEGLMLYNAHFARLIDGLHPQLFGAKVREAWPEYAEFASHTLSRVLAGETFAYRDQPFTLHADDAKFNRWMNLDYAPVRDEAGEPVAALVVMVDTTDRVQAEAALRRSEAQLSAIFAEAAVGLSEASLDGHFVRVNDALCRMLGRSRDELMCLSVPDVTHPDDVPNSLAGLRRLVETGEPTSLDKRYLRPDGSVVWANSIVSRLDDEQGQPATVLAVTVDLTDRKRAEEALDGLNNQLAADLSDMQMLQDVSSRLIPEGDIGVVLEEILAAAIHLSHGDAGNIHLVDAGSNELRLIAHRGLDPATLPLCAKFTVDIKACAVASWQCGERVIIDDLTAEDNFDPVLREAQSAAGMGGMQSTPLVSRTGQVLGVMTTHWREPRHPAPRELHSLDLLARQAADLIERHQAEAALRESACKLQEWNAALDERVRERTQELSSSEARLREVAAVASRRAEQLRGLAAQLVSAEQKERRQLAQVLHDHVQQLLVAAKMRVVLASEETVKPEVAASLRDVVTILDTTISATRSLAVELSPPVLQNQGLSAALHWLASQMRTQHHLEVEVAADPKADPAFENARDLLFQAARELLLNVVKHAGIRRAEVRLARDKETVVLEVSDRGRGFTPPESEIVSGSFGLFHIRERLEAVGGKLIVDSQPGKGTHAEITLPLVSAGEERDLPTWTAVEPPAFHPDHGPHKIRIVVADDHQIVREGLIQLLGRQSDMEVVGEAANGQVAVDLARRLRPDLVLMDVSMPILNGIDATRRISEELPEVQVIGLSLHEEDETAQAMLAAGAVQYLTKTRASNELVRTIRAAKTTPRG